MASSSSIKAGSAYVELLVKDSSFVKGLNKASKRLKAFGEGISSIGKKLMLAGGAVTGPLWECVDPTWVEPIWLPDAARGGKITGFYRCSYGCALHEVDPERRREWSPSPERIASLIAELIGCEAPLTDAPGRVWRLGRVERKGESRDVFIVRGGTWKDAPTALATATRLSASAQAVVLCLGRTPPPDKRPVNWRAALALDELVAVRRGKIVVAAARLFEDGARYAAPANASVLDALTQVELEVLQALAEAEGEPQLLVQLVAASGHKRDAVMRATRRLMSLGLVERPGATQRKGIVATDRGLNRVGRLPKTA